MWLTEVSTREFDACLYVPCICIPHLETFSTDYFDEFEMLCGKLSIIICRSVWDVRGLTKIICYSLLQLIILLGIVNSRVTK